MPTVEYLMLAGRVIRDESTKKYTPIDIFDRFTIPAGMDEITQFFSVFGKLDGIAGGDLEVEVKLIHEDGVTEILPGLGTSQLSAKDLVPGNLYFNGIFALSKISKPGRYYMQVHQNGKALDPDKKFYFVVEKEPANT